MSGEYLTCWHDDSRGLLTCKRATTEVNVNGYGVSGCIVCKTILGEPIAPATKSAEPFRNGWRRIPKEYLA